MVSRAYIFCGNTAGDCLKEKPESKDAQEKHHANAEMSVDAPLTLWVGLVAVAAVVQIFIFPAFHGSIISPIASYINMLAAYALYIPGILVLPILAAIWIGHRAGSTTGDTQTIAHRSVINAVYAGVVYLIAIFIFYIIANSAKAGALSAIPLISFIEYVVILPIAVCLIVSPLFAIITAAKKY